MLKAVVFDFDGLIVDTESVWYEVMCEICEEHGLPLPMEIWAKVVGTGDDPLFEYLEDKLGKPVDRVLIDQQGRERHKLKMGNRDVRPGVKSYLEGAQAHGLKIGLASSSSRQWVETFLKKFDIYHYFECIRTSDDVKNVKPDPELYISACQCLGVSPQEAIAFEDSPNGTRAAKAAGLTCFIVPNDITAKMSFDEYDYRINSMSEMDFGTLLKTVKL